ncbi:GTP-binding protein [Candidatus Omnitrophota bacterium]
MKILNIAMVGHVDHGKSTILGRLLVDTNSLPESKVKQVRDLCERNSKPFEYAFLIDVLKDEYTQGITIDSARVFFSRDKRKYLFIDAPGHIEFLKNMVAGASRAKYAFLVIDAAEGMQENSKRHGFLLSLLGIKQVVVVVNKMDLVSYGEKKFKRIIDECQKFFLTIEIKPSSFIPVSAVNGDNIVKMSDTMQWYKGKTLLETVTSFQDEEKVLQGSFRMPIQDVYKFTKFKDNRRIIAGTITSGKIHTDDEIVFYPSGKKSRVKSIETFKEDLQTEASVGQAIGLTLTEQLYVTRGEIAVNNKAPLPYVTSRLRVTLFWLSRKPMMIGKQYIFKLGTLKLTAMLEKVEKIIDPSDDLKENMSKEKIECNFVSECILKLTRPIAFDLIGDFLETSRFVIVDDYDISGGGIIRKALEDKQSWVRDKVLIRNYKWQKSLIPRSEKIKKYGQDPALIFIIGEKDVGKKAIARKLEERLFKEGRFVYFLAIGNILYGIDADIKGINDIRNEHLRRMAEVSHIMLDAGLILIVTAIELTQEDMKLIKAAVGSHKIETVWIGRGVTTDIEYSLKIDSFKDEVETVNAIEAMLKERNIVHER